MTDLSKNANLRVWNANRIYQAWMTLDSSSAQVVYTGCALILDQSADTLNAVIFDSGVTLAAGDIFLGIAAGPISVASGDVEADSKIEMYEPGSIVGFNQTQFGSSYTNTNIHDDIYLSDSGTLTTTAGSNLKIGYIWRIEDGYIYVMLEHWTAS